MHERVVQRVINIMLSAQLASFAISAERVLSLQRPANGDIRSACKAHSGRLPQAVTASATITR